MQIYEYIYNNHLPSFFFLITVIYFLKQFWPHISFRISGFYDLLPQHSVQFKLDTVKSQSLA